jgi:hypothetical protein
MSWRVAITDVRQHENGSRWTVEAVQGAERLIVHADTMSDGSVLWLQCDDGSSSAGERELAQGTGNSRLDAQIIDRIQRLVRHRRLMSQAERMERRQRRRPPRPTFGQLERRALDV